MSATRWVSVEVDLDEFDDGDLIEELESRGRSTGMESKDDDITEMFYAFKLGRNDLAIEIAKKIARDHTGRIL